MIFLIQHARPRCTRVLHWCYMHVSDTQIDRLFFYPSRPNGCPSDFHYIMTSESARNMAVHILPHLLKYRNTTNVNHAMENFVRDLLGVKYRTDHVVIGRHEEVFRKTQNLMMEANFFKCTRKQYQKKR